MVLTGWRGLAALVAVLLVLALLLTALFWLAALALAVAAAAWLSLGVLPRLAERLHVPQLALALGLLAVLVAGGLLLGGTTSALAACGVWLVGVALPRAVLWKLRSQLRRRVASGHADPLRIQPPRVIDV
jgi:4-hydroxybenzoate polyprenyltransferase